MAEIPIRRNQNQPRTESAWPRRLIITAIIILTVVNIGFVYFIYYKAKVLAESATDAAKNAETFSGFGKGKDLPTADVAGQDIDGVGRYKGSIRTKYLKEDNQTVIEYQTKDTSKLVLGYFKTQLANAGWILQESDNDSVTFHKENSFITIATSENQTDKITTYKIIY